jgi:hypothetical protein
VSVRSSGSSTAGRRDAGWASLGASNSAGAVADHAKNDRSDPKDTRISSRTRSIS